MGRDLRARMLEVIKEDFVSELQTRTVDFKFALEIKRLAELSGRIHELVKEISKRADKD